MCHQCMYGADDNTLKAIDILVKWKDWQCTH